MNEIKGVITVDANSFHKLINEAKIPVIVDFYADWCGPCKMMAPVMDRLSEKYNQKAIFAKVNIDIEQKLAQDHHVMSIPNFIIFKDGKAVENILGAVPEAHIEEALERAGASQT